MYIFDALIWLLWHWGMPITHKESIYCRVLYGDQSHNVHAKAISPAANCPFCSFHIPETVPKHNSNYRADIHGSLRWHHNEHDCVSNHHRFDCLLNRLFRSRSKKISKVRITGLCVWNSPETGEFPTQRASNAEIVSIWWRHHILQCQSNNFISGLSFLNVIRRNSHLRLQKLLGIWPVLSSTHKTFGDVWHNSDMYDFGCYIGSTLTGTNRDLV